MASNFIDNMANMVVLGYLIRDPSIIEANEKFRFSKHDFQERMQKIVFISIYNLYVGGLKKIEAIDIFNYLTNSSPEDGAYFDNHDGIAFVKKCEIIADEHKIEYYYDRMKKMSLLRSYDEHGVNIKDLYDPDTIDEGKIRKQEEYLETHSIEEIMNDVDLKIEKIKDNFRFEGFEKADLLADEVDDFLKNIETEPSLGMPAPFGMWNTITAGLRLNKIFILSGTSGLGKSRNLLAHMAYLSCGEYYDTMENRWIETGFQEPTLFISTELEKSEVLAMALSFVSGVNEEKVLKRQVPTFDEAERIEKAIEIVRGMPLYIEIIPDFSIEDIERCIKLNIEKNDVNYVAFDYIHTSLKILEEVSQRTRGVNLREDNVLFMLSTKLKDLANKYGVFIITGTQVNRGIDSGNEITSSMLRGASSIADKADLGCIMTRLSDNDRTAYEKIKGKTGTNIVPNFIYNIYKNRGTPYANCKVWCIADLGTCHIYPLFVTDNNYMLMNVPTYDINVMSGMG